jgi:surfeit locus 1 family protein
MRFRPGLAPTGAMLLAVAVLCALGTWQVRRHHWKQALLAEWNARIDQPPAPLADVLADPEAYRYRRARARGVYDPDASILVQHVPRGLREGARVLTPLRVDERTVVLVDRGWVASAEARRFLEEDVARGPVEVTGLVFPLAEPASAPRRVDWLHFDPTRESQVSALQAQLPYRLTPVLLQQDFERPHSRVDHVSYAITWYGMAVAAFAVWVGFGIQRARAE